MYRLVADDAPTRHLPFDFPLQEYWMDKENEERQGGMSGPTRRFLRSAFYRDEKRVHEGFSRPSLDAVRS